MNMDREKKFFRVCIRTEGFNVYNSEKLFNPQWRCSMEDEKILGLYRQRNEAAISATGEKYGGYCHIIAYNILASREDSEESVSDTYFSVIRGAFFSIKQTISSIVLSLLRISSFIF